MAREQLLGRLLAAEALAGRIHVNVTQDYLLIVEDRLKHDLRDYTEVLDHKRPVAAVFSTLVTLLAVVVTSESNDVLLTSYAWKLVFVGSFVLALIWLCYCCCLWIKFRRSKISTVDGILCRIKEGSTVLKIGDIGDD